MAVISASMLSTFLLATLVTFALGFTDSGVPCYLRPAGEDCHYHPKSDSPICSSAEDKARLKAGVIKVNATLASLVLQLIRLGVIPPDSSCSELPSLTNGGIIYSDLSLSPGSTGRYICNEGYILNTLFGRKEFTCTEDGIWDGNVTSIPVDCQLTAERCNPPQALKNGNITFMDDDPSNILSGDIITYTCDPGMQLKGPQYRYCQRNGNWSGVEPLCDQDNKAHNITSDSQHRDIIIGSTVGGISGFLMAVIVGVIVVCAIIKLRNHWRKSHLQPGLRVYNESTNRNSTSNEGDQYVSFPASPTKSASATKKKSIQSGKSSSSSKGELEESTM